MRKYSAEKLLTMKQKDRPFQIKMVERNPIKSVITRYTHMSNSPGGNLMAAQISKETGFYMVDPQESVIFYSKGELDNPFLDY